VILMHCFVDKSPRAEHYSTWILMFKNYSPEEIVCDQQSINCVTLALHQEVGVYICVYMRSLLYLTPNPQIGIKICSILGRPLSKKGKRK
jgi:hypothetical protein